MLYCEFKYDFHRALFLPWLFFKKIIFHRLNVIIIFSLENTTMLAPIRAWKFSLNTVVIYIYTLWYIYIYILWILQSVEFCALCTIISNSFNQERHTNARIRLQRTHNVCLIPLYIKWALSLGKTFSFWPWIPFQSDAFINLHRPPRINTAPPL